MAEHFELKDYHYEDRRMDFFKQKRLEAERRVKHWEKRAVNSAYNSIQQEKVCDAVDELCFYSDAVKALETQQWISVKDRLPNAEGEYLVFQHGYSGYKFVRTASFNVCYSGIDDDMHGKAVWYDYDSECGDYELIGITHWMPLPEPPKEKNE